MKSRYLASLQEVHCLSVFLQATPEEVQCKVESIPPVSLDATCTEAECQAADIKMGETKEGCAGTWSSSHRRGKADTWGRAGHQRLEAKWPA